MSIYEEYCEKKKSKIYNISLGLLFALIVLEILLWIVVLKTIKYETNLYSVGAIIYPWPAFIALIQIFFASFNPDIPSYRILSFNGMDCCDIISRIFSLMVSILIMAFGIINTIAADFIISNNVLK